MKRLLYSMGFLLPLILAWGNNVTHICDVNLFHLTYFWIATGIYCIIYGAVAFLVYLCEVAKEIP